MGCGDDKPTPTPTVVKAAFSATPTAGKAPMEVQFTDASTGDITAWAWNFGDGGTSSEKNPKHTFQSNGDFTISLTVTGASGSTGTETKTNYIRVGDLVAEFTATPTSGLPPLAVQFTDQSVGDITAWEWDFDNDGTVDSTAPNPSHTYDTVGKYTVSLKVSGSDGTVIETKVDYIEAAAYETIILKLSHASPEMDSLGKAAQKFADLVEEYTGGRVEVQMFPAGSLYDATTEWEALTTGAVDIVPRYSWFMAASLPAMLVMALSEIWDGYEHALNFYSSPELATIIETALEPDGVQFLAAPPAYMQACWANSVKEIKTALDMTGLRRAKGPGTPDVPRDIYCGIVTVEVPRADMITALQTGVADLQSSYVSTLVATSAWDVTPHGFVTQSGPMAAVFMMNLNTWNGLPPDIQTIISDQVMPELMQYSYNLMIQSENEALVTLLANMTSLNKESDAEKQALWTAMENDPSVVGLKTMIGTQVMDLIESTRPSAS